MKKIYIYSLFSLLLLSVSLFAQTDGGVSIGKGNIPAHDKAILEIVSSNKGLLIPRMTTLQREGIFTAADESAKGLLVYDNDQSTLFSWDGSKWSALKNAANVSFSIQGNKLVLTDSDGKSVSVALTDLQTGITPIGTVPPASAVAGATYFNSSEQRLYVYNGTSWDPIGADGSTPTSATAPVVGVAGSTYYNTTDKKFYVSNGTGWALVDTDAQQLTLTGMKLSIANGNTIDLSSVSASVPSGSTVPATGSTGDTFFNTTDKKFYVNNGTAWVPVDTDTNTDFQTLSVSGSILSISGGNSVTLPASGGSGTDSQTLSLSGTNLTITNGNTVNLSSISGSGTPSGATNPSTGTTGDTFFNTTDNKLYVYNGSSWDPVGTDGSTPTYTTAPAVGTSGETYYNTTENKLYVSDGVTWVSVTGGSSGSVPSGLTNPASGTTGDTFFNTTDNSALCINSFGG